MKPIHLLCCCLTLAASAADTAWPPLTSEAKPWIRWWWLGSGVDAGNLTSELEAFSEAGIGGVEICPIYGAKGYESRDLKFLSGEWVTAYAHAAKEAGRLGMGIDLTTGTGWPFGAPWVKQAEASASLQSVKASAPGEVAVSLSLPEGKIEVLSAWPEQGLPVDLLPFVKEGRLVWTPSAGQWTIHGLVSKHGIQKVKRAAPGGAGWVLDPFSTASMDAYLKPFSTALDRDSVPEPRAHFHDSFEYYGAEWTDDLLDRFRELRGYDLASRLPAFHGEGDPDTVARVRADYRQTMSDLHRGYLARWHGWAASRGSLTRNQAHGSPGNPLDHYAVADIPETEIFRHVGEEQIPMLQFAASAAHLTGRNLVSAESFTWLDEHFKVTPAKLKEAADFVWLGGVNHIFFHGIPYTPADAPWPGWLFYASTHMGPKGGLWRDLPAFNAYIARCQSVLQSGEPDSEVLLYFPMDELWHDGAEGLPLFTVHNQDKWLHGSGFYQEAMGLWKAGIPCEFVSDRMLESAAVKDGMVQLGGRAYRTLIIPPTDYMPIATAVKLQALAGEGATISFCGDLPSKASGLRDAGRSPANEMAKKFEALPSGRIFRAANAVEAAKHCGVGIEADLARLKLRFIRRTAGDSTWYFIANTTGTKVDERVKLAREGKSAVMLDPWTGRSGTADFGVNARLLLEAGESRIIRVFHDRIADGPPWKDHATTGTAVPLEGSWEVRFFDGGPELPESYQGSKLASWTTRNGDAYRSFSGTALYRLEFGHGSDSPSRLSLGEVCHTARVRLNGIELGTCWAPPHQIETGNALKNGKNVLEIEVTNLAANRIADLDRRGLPWKSFHEINFVNIDYKPFDASKWEPLPSGLLGPVTIAPLR